MGRPPPHKRLMTRFDSSSAHQQTALKSIKASRSSAGQSTRFRGERSQDRSLPRRPIGALIGDGAGPVLKTVSTATCGDRDLSAPPFHGRLTGQGPSAGRKTARYAKAYGHRALSLPPFMEGQPGRRRAPVRSGMDGQPLGGIKTSAFHQLSRGPPMANAPSRR